MKKIIFIVIVLAVLVGGVFIYQKFLKGEGVVLTPGETVELSGVAVVINSDQIAFDGPYVVALKVANGPVVNVAVPSMGLPMCAAYQAGNVVGVNLIKLGDEVKVKGQVAEDGSVVPCESADHYLRNE